MTKTKQKTKIILSIFFCSSHCIFHCISFCKISSWAVKYKEKKFQSFKTQSYNSGHRLQVVTHTLFSGSRLVKEAKFMNSVKIPTHVEYKIMVTKSYVREGKDLCLSCVDFSIIFSIKMEMSLNILYIMMPYSVSNLKSEPLSSSR